MTFWLLLRERGIKHCPILLKLAKSLIQFLIYIEIAEIFLLTFKLKCKKYLINEDSNTT